MLAYLGQFLNMHVSQKRYEYIVAFHCERFWGGEVE